MVEFIRCGEPSPRQCVTHDFHSLWSKAYIMRWHHVSDQFEQFPLSLLENTKQQLKTICKSWHILYNIYIFEILHRHTHESDANLVTVNFCTVIYFMEKICLKDHRWCALNEWNPFFHVIIKSKFSIHFTEMESRRWFKPFFFALVAAVCLFGVFRFFVAVTWNVTGFSRLFIWAFALAGWKFVSSAQSKHNLDK